MDTIDWKMILEEFESEFALSRKERMRAQSQKQKVEDALRQAESTSADAEIIDRLDMMLIALIEATKENVCTNTKCPHYNKKCKMR